MGRLASWEGIGNSLGSDIYKASEAFGIRSGDSLSLSLPFLDRCGHDLKFWEGLIIGAQFCGGG